MKNLRHTPSHDIRESPPGYVVKVSREKRLLARFRRMMFIGCHNRIDITMRSGILCMRVTK